jgi:hypothetical protein
VLQHMAPKSQQQHHTAFAGRACEEGGACTTLRNNVPLPPHIGMSTPPQAPRGHERKRKERNGAPLTAAAAIAVMPTCSTSALMAVVLHAPSGASGVPGLHSRALRVPGYPAGVRVRTYRSTSAAMAAMGADTLVGTRGAWAISGSRSTWEEEEKTPQENQVRLHNILPTLHPALPLLRHLATQTARGLLAGSQQRVDGVGGTEYQAIMRRAGSRLNDR